jgi:hypothetical protein
MNQSLFVIAFLFMTFISSCTNSVQEKQLKEVTTLITKRDSLENVYAQNKFDSLNYWRLEASNIEITIKRNYVANKVDNKLSAKMNRFKSMQEIIDAESELGGEGEYEEEEKEMTLGRRMMLLNRAFQKVKSGLDNLRTDLKNNVLEEAQAKTYIQAESIKVKKIENQLTQYLFVKNTELKEYIQLCKELRVFADSLALKL